MWASVVYSATAIGVGLATTFPVALAFYLLGMMSAGVFQPVRQAYLHMVVQREQRATVLSLASLVSSGGSMGGQAGLGWLASRYSLGAGYMAGGLITAIVVPILLLMRRAGGAPDLIRGEAGRYTKCPTLALPEGVAVGAERDLTAETAVAGPVVSSTP
jgi:MFS family permease